MRSGIGAGTRLAIPAGTRCIIYPELGTAAEREQTTHESPDLASVESFACSNGGGAFHDLAFARGIEQRHAKTRLLPRDRLGESDAPRDKRNELLVERIDLGA